MVISIFDISLYRGDRGAAVRFFLKPTKPRMRLYQNLKPQPHHKILKPHKPHRENAVRFGSLRFPHVIKTTNYL